MGISIPKIKVGKSRLNNQKFDLSKNVASTFGFGEIQPMFKRLLQPGSKIHIDYNQFVRLAPMPCPTFGQLTLRNYFTFVPMHEICPQYDALMTGQSYLNYTPTRVPNLSIRELSALCLYKARVAFVDITNGAFAVVKPTASDYAQIIQSFCNVYRKLPWTPTPQAPFEMDFDYAKVEDNAQDFICRFANGSKRYQAHIYLSYQGKIIRKTLIGLGYQINLSCSSLRVPVLPLFAYWKALWDRFNNDRVQNYESSEIYKLINYVNYYNRPNIDEDYQGSLFFAQVCVWWLNNLWYTKDSDFVSANILDVSNGNGLLSSPFNLDSNGDTLENFSLGSDSQPSVINVDGVVQLSQSSLNMLQKLYKYVNKNSVIGKNVQELMATHFGLFKDDMQARFVNEHTTEINIDDNMSQSDTYTPASTDSPSSGSLLGEYSGVGIGFGKSKFTFETKEYGYLIGFSCVVPISQYYQGIDGENLAVERWDFHNPEFDGLGYEVTRKAQVLLAKDVYESTVADNTPDEAFGYVPRYSGIKWNGDIINGDMSLRSMRETYQAFHLGKTLNNGAIELQPSLSGSTWRPHYEVAPMVLGASPDWRYIGKDVSIGNYDRIFAYSGVTPPEYWVSLGYDDFGRADNFIVQTKLKVDLYAPMKPISESFETVEGDNLTVSHS